MQQHIYVYIYMMRNYTESDCIRAIYCLVCNNQTLFVSVIHVLNNGHILTKYVKIDSSPIQTLVQFRFETLPNY